MKTKVLTASALVAALAGPAFAEGDPAKGEKVYRKCKSCHMIGTDAKNRAGPILTGIVGAAAASVEGFNYSDALSEKAAEGLAWSEENLTAYLSNPKEFIPGNRMSFAGLRKDDDIVNLIAYLATFE